MDFFLRQKHDKEFARWKVNEVTFCKSMEGETMVLVVSEENMKCPEDKWDSNASSEWCSGHI